MGAGERVVPGSHALVLQRSFFVPEWEEGYMVNIENNICGTIMVPDVTNTFTFSL